MAGRKGRGKEVLPERGAWSYAVSFVARTQALTHTHMLCAYTESRELLLRFPVLWFCLHGLNSKSTFVKHITWGLAPGQGC